MSKQKRQFYEFDNFRLDVGERLLLRDGEPITLPAKAFDLLLVLIENSGRVVEKEDLYEKVWADQIVEESNLTVQMSAIRKALGERKQNPRYIVTVPGRGYRFVGDVANSQDEELVIETQTLSRVVIEQEEEEGKSQLVASILPPAFESDRPETGIALSAAQVSAQPKRTLLSRRGIALFAGLFVLVAVTGAVWFYQSRNRNGHATLSPAPQMKLRRFTTHGGYPFRVAISPDGKSLVYCQRITGKDSLWLGQIETNTSVPLNQQPDVIFDNLVFSPDGTSVYFNVGGGNRPRSMLSRMPVLGGVITELIPAVDSAVTFSPDGTQMAFLGRDSETGQRAIIIADGDGQNQRKLISRMPSKSFSSEELSWSPDGKRIAFSALNASGEEEIAAANVADASVSRIGGRDWTGVDNVKWLPDGSGLLVVGHENVGERRRHVWLVAYPDGEARRITNDMNIFLHSNLSISGDGKLAVLQGHISSEIWIAPRGDTKQARRVLQGVAPRYEGVDGLAWTPDDRLLYSAYVGDSLVIWSINSDGGDLRQLTPSKPNISDSHMCVTADGRYVVFESNRSGALEIWRVNSDGTNLKQLTAGGNNYYPTLTPDGQWVVYASSADGKTGLWRISIEGGEATQIARTSSSVIQVSPDGRYIACMTSSARLLIFPFTGGEVVKSFHVSRLAMRGVRMRWTPDGNAIIYRGDPQGLWRQSLDEQTPQMVKGFEELYLRQFAWSPDGKDLGYVSGSTGQEIILIENFK